MLLLLVVLVMLIVWARDPETWRWLARDEVRDAPGAAPAAQAAADSAQAPAATGPTDEDPEEADFVKEAFEAVTDLTTNIDEVEMPAYQRLVQWSLNQPFELMDRRARPNVLFAQLINAPAEFRGKLVRLNLTLNRVLPWDLPIYETPTLDKKKAKPEKVLRVYEACGFSADSGAHLYTLLLVSLPEGMPTGDKLSARVRFAGYFFKVQRYLDGLNRPGRTAVLIGRIEREPPSTPPLQPIDWYVAFGLGGMVLAVIVAAVVGTIWGWRHRTTRQTLPTSSGSGTSIEEWFDRASKGELSEGNTLPIDRESVMGDARSNGQSRPEGPAFPRGLDTDRPVGGQ